ncbi:RICIN domain-containing protein [Lentzea sp. NPDC058436]|uniref:RICIN domain-containing protein n=1 Tax=Lentzea sp. NPDC058436 TaxID=3346499 RepID=UPI003663B676
MLRRLTAFTTALCLAGAGVLLASPAAQAFPRSETVNSTSDEHVLIAVDWCGDDERKNQEAPPCGTGSTTRRLPPGNGTPALEDWDGVRVDAGSVMRYELLTVTVSVPPQYIRTQHEVDRRGVTSQWIRIHDNQTVTVQSVQRGLVLRNVNSGLCMSSSLGAGERPATQRFCASPAYLAPEQRWQLVPIASGERRYRIRNTLLGLCLATRGFGESLAVMTTCSTGTTWPDQIWTPQAVPSAQADRFVNTYSNLCLVARGTGESQLLQSTCGNWADQYWK